jgi:transcription elongation factor GreA
MQEILMSQETYDSLKQELNELNNEKPEVLERIAEARSHGDLSENAEYHAARERLAFIDAKIAQIGLKLSNAKIVDKSKISTDKVGYGVSVKLYNKKTKKRETFTVVGDGEADPDNNEISLTSPLGRALDGKKVDEEIEVKLPFGLIGYKIKEIFVK